MLEACVVLLPYDGLQHKEAEHRELQRTQTCEALCHDKSLEQYKQLPVSAPRGHTESWVRYVSQ